MTRRPRLRRSSQGHNYKQSTTTESRRRHASFLPPVQPHLLSALSLSGFCSPNAFFFFPLLEGTPLREAWTVAAVVPQWSGDAADMQQGRRGGSLGLATPTCHQRSASKPKLPISSGDPSPSPLLPPPSSLHLPEGTVTYSPLQSALFHAQRDPPRPSSPPPLLRAG